MVLYLTDLYPPVTTNTPQKGLHSLINVQMQGKNLSYLFATVS